MNYRHAFHAGNFADLVKHAALTSLLSRLRAEGGPLAVLDTHAGAGAYDLGGEMALKSREGEAARRLMADDGAPPAFDALKAAVRALNPDGGLRFYPGSPLVAAGLLGRGDRYLGCELRPDDHALLARALEGVRGPAELKALKADGYAQVRGGAGRRLVLIDPPFERADEYDRVVDATAAAGDAAVLVWLPLKDLDTFDRFVGRIEDHAAGALVTEVRLRPLDNPLALNGCALVAVGAPDGAEADIRAAAKWVVGRLGAPGGEARVWRTGA